MQQRPPISWDMAARSRRRLILGMRVRRREFHAVNHRLFLVIPKPILAGFETRRHGMAARSRVARSVLAGRAVTATDMPAFGATPKV